MKWPAILSFAAAAITAAIAIFGIVGQDATHNRWVLLISIPPIVGSAYQGAQYRKGQSANAFWPVAVYLFFIVVYLFAALALYFCGVILQSTAWILGRREHRRRLAMTT
jgi:hypothetical protein